MVVGFFWVLGHILGLVILAIALHRARVLPLWAATLMALSQPVHLVSAVIVPSRWLDVFGGWGITTLTCALVSVWILRTPRLRLGPAAHSVRCRRWGPTLRWMHSDLRRTR